MLLIPRNLQGVKGRPASSDSGLAAATYSRRIFRRSRPFNSKAAKSWYEAADCRAGQDALIVSVQCCSPAAQAKVENENEVSPEMKT